MQARLPASRPPSAGLGGGGPCLFAPALPSSPPPALARRPRLGHQPSRKRKRQPAPSQIPQNPPQTQVTAAMRLADGVLLVVDALEGVMAVTERAVRQAVAEGLAVTLLISKVGGGVRGF